MNYDFSSALGLDSMIDEEIVENILTDEWCKKFYDAPKFKDAIIDVGGGVKMLHCRAILAITENSADNLLSFLGLKRNQKNLADCMQILDECTKSMAQSAYLA